MDRRARIREAVLGVVERIHVEYDDEELFGFALCTDALVVQFFHRFCTESMAQNLSDESRWIPSDWERIRDEDGAEPLTVLSTLFVSEDEAMSDVASESFGECWVNSVRQERSSGSRASASSSQTVEGSRSRASSSPASSIPPTWRACS